VDILALQLFFYTSRLSFRTDWVDMFRCAWFDEKDHFEFEPAQAKVDYSRSDVADCDELKTAEIKRSVWNMLSEKLGIKK